MPARFLISSVTVGSGGASNIEFTSIPATYTDLVVRVSTRSAYTVNPNDLVFVTLNNSTSNFSAIYLTASNTSTFSGSAARFAADSNSTGYTSNTFSNADIYFPNYASSNYKSYSTDTVIEGNFVGTNLGFVAGLWSDTSAITAIKLTNNSASNFTQYSTAYLYGIKNS